jgi:ribosome-binding ATPase YchF (GTP1/OBG family)
MAKEKGADAVIISAKIESEMAGLTDEEKQEFLTDLGLKETGLTSIVRTGFKLLDILTFFTIGPKEARAWTVRRGATAPEAAGVIHTDFEKGFIRAETIACDDYIALGGEQARRSRQAAP